MRKLITERGIVVSCQAYMGEPLYGPHYMAEMAKGAELGGAIGIRANGIADIFVMKQSIQVPIIGLHKRNIEDNDVYITPTLKDALAVYAAGADIVAIDGTNRMRPDGRTLAQTVQELKRINIPIMADISNEEEGLFAAELGVDYISTTLSGYTPYSTQSSNPDIELVARLASVVRVPVVAEGKYFTAEEVNRALEAGAQFVVIGSAITRPQHITERFVQAISSQIKSDNERL
ncbi:putative N-acetylmannosamine-6-phosphate 2-epimerase [Paenibacillus sp. LMG 31458]|uniref:Putative N-acetylmannosamine-6-phosphate 2-epimerase n=1 Tax=Paenibacillus phytorum TaxID=2654977 RepID=A0ABX1Y3U1_9BACL|nr:N-acetylmannosamine-6-phosphate 2-epimerase [Paenibacillus phytorum]NOU75532.1 putative N-acetylmannosamine-6-phosphate 2-epimerase [Paenibacillus phytorum]